jgi:hypothetical protein
MALKFNYDYEIHNDVISIYDNKYEVTEEAVLKLNVKYVIYQLNYGFEIEIDEIIISSLQYDGWVDYVNGEETTIEIEDFKDFSITFSTDNSSGEDKFTTVITNIEVDIDKKTIEITFTQE